MITMSPSGLHSQKEPPGGRCVFTIDLEEYFEVKVVRKFVPPAEWDSLPARADRAVSSLLGFLSRYGARATFFVSPWISETRPLVVRKVAAAGHEVATLARMPRTDVPPEERREMWGRVVRETRDRLEQTTGRRVLGCRSPRFRHPIPAGEAIEVLAEAGYRYDATLSRNAIRSAFDGERSEAPLRLPPADGAVLAVPPSTFSLFGRRMFTVGRTAFRVLPFSMTSRILARDASRGHVGVFSMRAWEMDPAQPTLPVSLPSRIRLYWGLHRVSSRLDRLLQRFSFDSAAGALGLEAREASPPATREGGSDREERPRRSVRRMHG